MAVLSTVGPRARLFVLEPAADARGELAFNGFYVRGAFRVAEKINHTARAREAYAAFVPA